MAHGDHVSTSWTKKWYFLEDLAKHFSELLDSKFLILIEFPNILHWKPAKKSNWVWSWGKILAKLCSML